MGSSRRPWPGSRAASRSSSDGPSQFRSTPRRRNRASAADAGVLVPFPASAGEVVLGWVTSDDEARRWASLDSRPSDVAVFTLWHAEPGVRAFLLLVAGRPIGYGEIWEDPEEGEAELARLIVDPSLRGRGFGRALAGALLAEARRLGWPEVWLRVVPENEPALRAYAAAGFTRATTQEAAAFNVGQPVEFVWMRAPAAQVPK